MIRGDGSTAHGSDAERVTFPALVMFPRPCCLLLLQLGAPEPCGQNRGLPVPFPAYVPDGALSSPSTAWRLEHPGWWVSVSQGRCGSIFQPLGPTLCSRSVSGHAGVSCGFPAETVMLLAAR